MTNKNDALATRLAHRGRATAVAARTVNPPLDRASTILFDDMDALLAGGDSSKPSYGRQGLGIHRDFADAMCALEGAEGSWTFPSGLAAVVMSLIVFAKAGTAVLLPDNVYTPTRKFLQQALSRLGVESRVYSPRIDLAGLEPLLESASAMVLESPGSHTFEMLDVPALAACARAHGVATIMDATWASPLFVRPLDLGVDISVHAGTKYIGGHSDIMLGVLSARGEVAEQTAETWRVWGQRTSPDDVWLALRGLRTLDVRMTKHQANALALARWLDQRPEVARVMYPALEGDPGHALWRRDFTGASGLFGVEMAPAPREALVALVNGMRLFGRGWSWGGFESLMVPSSNIVRDHPLLGAPDPARTLRIHAGLEDPNDLIGDLDTGLARWRALAG